MEWVEREESILAEMAVSVSILAIIISLHLIAFVFTVGAERRPSTVTLSRSLLL